MQFILDLTMVYVTRCLFQAYASIVSSSSKKISSGFIEELKLPLVDGTVLAAQRWTPPRIDHQEKSFDHTIICTHGWLDNCRTFYKLAPALVSNLNAQVIAIDFPGHGWSSHKSLDSPPLVQADLVYYLCEAMNVLASPKSTMSVCNNTKFTLIGHSLGAGVASLTAAAFPERVDKLVMLDAASFLARKPEDTALHVRNHISQRQKYDPKKAPRLYSSVELAIQVRKQSATRMPGKQTLSYEAASELVTRATDNCLDKDVQFLHDRRFNWPSMQYMTWEQNEGIFQSLGTSDVKTCLLIAEDGWPVEPYQVDRVKELMKPNDFQTLPGNHYFHANPDTSDLVVDTIVKFLKK
jgi:pimeloyl-ACP methyl ester carboxylesterase